MAGLLEALFGQESDTIDGIRKEAGGDQKRAEQTMGATVGTIVRGLERKAQSEEGAASIWDMLREQVQKGNIPSKAPKPGSGVQVRDLDPAVTDKILKSIFGENAPKVEGSIGKVITLDEETTKKVLGKVLPTVLGGIFGQAEQSPQESPRALPDILSGARKEIEQKQPKSGSIFDAILDSDHDGDVDLGDLVGLFRGKS